MTPANKFAPSFALALATLALTFYPCPHAEGHGAHEEPQTQPAQQVAGTKTEINGVTYLNLGDYIQVGPYQLKLSSNRTQGPLYLASVDVSALSPLPQGPVSLDLPKGNAAAGFARAGAVTMPSPNLELTGLDQKTKIAIQRENGLKLEWISDAPRTSRVQIIVENLKVNTEDSVSGRITFETLNEGSATVPAELLRQLAAGKARLALKIIQPTSIPDHESETVITVFSVRTLVIEAEVL
jgi:hypothetical protein